MINYSEYKINYNKLKCVNCGNMFHNYKNCDEAIMSFGLICYKYVNDQYKYLLIQRKHTISYIDFLRGKYTDQIKFLIDTMTYKEKISISNNSFDKLWNDLWKYNKNHKSFKYEYNYAKNKFNSSLEIVISLLANNKGFNFVDSRGISTLSKFPNNTLEWGFPKGRRNKNETDLNTAKREFIEETNINSDNFVYSDTLPVFNEEFLGSNGITYRYIYFIAKANSNTNVNINLNNIHQSSEIGDIGWFTYNEAKLLLKNNIRRLGLLEKINNLLNKK